MNNVGNLKGTAMTIEYPVLAGVLALGMGEYEDARHFRLETMTDVHCRTSIYKRPLV